MNLREALNYTAKPVPYDEARYREAGLVLVNNRDQLTHRVFFKIPDPGAMTTNRDPIWDEIKAGSTGERCNCGNCRTIWPKKWSEFVQKETRTLREGEKFYIVPEGGNYKDTTVLVEVVKGDNGKPFLATLMDPFSEAFDLSILLGRKGYALDSLAEAMTSQDKPARMAKKFPDGAGVNAEHMTLFTINSATPDQVVIGIGEGYLVSMDPEKEFPIPAAHSS
ncbi:hypothetical protein HYT05_04165 [Candidatus Kaiserbacteria bacterium]|nr:hypothetical protein [Candidatus Kaiserbacteria bacterium]